MSSFSTFPSEFNSEAYARKRLEQSPLHFLSPLKIITPKIIPAPLLSSPISRTEYKSKELKETSVLTSRTYLFLKRSLCSLINYIQKTEKDASLSEICEILSQELNSIRAVGLQYIVSQTQEEDDPDEEDKEDKEEDEEEGELEEVREPRR